MCGSCVPRSWRVLNLHLRPPTADRRPTDRSSRSPGRPPQARNFRYTRGAGPVYNARRRETGGATKALRLNFDSRSRTHRTLPRGRLRDTAPPRKSLCDKIIESWAAPERHRSARLAPVTGTPLLRRARPARGAERTIDPSGGHSPAVQRAHLMRLCLPQDLRHTSTAHLARTPCVAEPGYLIELCSQRSRTYPHTGHPHGHPQTGSDNRV